MGSLSSPLKYEPPKLIGLDVIINLRVFFYLFFIKGLLIDAVCTQAF